MAVKTYNELFSNLNKVLEKNIDKLRIHSTDIINKFIEQYYSEYEPSKYRRTFQFLNSVVSVETKKVGNQFVSDIYIDLENMHHYTQKQIEKDSTLYTEYNLVNAINEGHHGFPYYEYTSDKYFWDLSVDEIYNGKILHEFVRWIKEDTRCSVHIN